MGSRQAIEDEGGHPHVGAGPSRAALVLCMRANDTSPDAGATYEGARQPRTRRGTASRERDHAPLNANGMIF